MRIATPDVAVIGAGFAGVALAVRLLWTLPDGAQLLLVGTPGETGHGCAYGTELPDHLLNVRAGRMSVVSDEPYHFVSWLRQHGHGNADLEESYQPRPLYGTYLRDTLYKSSAAQRGRVRTEVHEGTVIDLERQAGGFAVQLGDGQRVKAKAVILATGNARGDFPFGVGDAGDAIDFMIRDPFFDYRMKSIGTDTRVLLVGTGLTMVDQLLRLEANGHQKPVTAVSRHGLLPSAHPSRPRGVRQPELPVGASLAALLRSFIADSRQAIREGDDWQSVLDGIRPHLPRLWRGLSPADRARFFRHAEAFWSVHRHRMAPSIGTRVAAMQSEGRFTIRAGRVVGLRRARQGVTVALRPRGVTTIDLLSFDWMINCSGIRPRGARTDPFIATLVGRGLARSAGLAGGIDVTLDSRVVGRGGVPEPGLFAAGPLTVGTFFEITAVPEIREQAARVAKAATDFLADAAVRSVYARA